MIVNATEYKKHREIIEEFQKDFMDSYESPDKKELQSNIQAYIFWNLDRIQRLIIDSTNDDFSKNALFSLSYSLQVFFPLILKLRPDLKDLVEYLERLLSNQYTQD